MNPADYKDDDVVRYAKEVVNAAQVDPNATVQGHTWVEIRFAHTITRFAQRIAWLENELENMDRVISSTMALRNTSRLDHVAYDKAVQAVSDAVRAYWEEDLDDDGTEP